MNIHHSLQTLGLSDKEAAVYAAILKMKKGTALTVAEAAGIKRPTAYLVLESLIQKKLVTSTKFRNVKDYRALPLEHLKSFVYKQKSQAEKALPAIQTLYDKRQFKVRLRVYKGPASVKTLLEKSLREKKPMSILGNESWFQHTLGMYWKYFVKRSQQLSILPTFKSYHGTVMLMLWSDKVAFVEHGGSGQVFGFKNKELHDVYQHLWNNFDSPLGRGRPQPGVGETIACPATHRPHPPLPRPSGELSFPNMR